MTEIDMNRYTPVGCMFGLVVITNDLHGDRDRDDMDISNDT